MDYYCMIFNPNQTTFQVNKLNQLTHQSKTLSIPQRKNLLQKNQFPITYTQSHIKFQTSKKIF